MIHTVKGFSVVNKAEVDVFLELSCLFNDPTDVWQFEQSARRSNQSILKKDNAKESLNYQRIALMSHTSKVMFKILQVRLQQYVNQELPDVQVGFRKGRGTRD